MYGLDLASAHGQIACPGEERSNSVEFALLPQQQFKGSLRVLISLFVVFQVVNLSLLLLGAFSVVTSIGFTIMLAVTLSALFWAVHRQGQGVARMTPAGLLITTRGGERSYSWDHLSSICLSSPAQGKRLLRLWTHIVGRNLNEPFIELKLTRFVRESPFTLLHSRQGTNIFGLPIPGTRVFRLYLEHPERFVELSRPFLVSVGSKGESPTSSA